MVDLVKEVESITQEVMRLKGKPSHFDYVAAMNVAVQIQRNKILIEGLDLFENKLTILAGVIDGLRDDVRSIYPLL